MAGSEEELSLVGAGPVYPLGSLMQVVGGVLYTVRTSSAPAYGHGRGVEWRRGYPDAGVAGHPEHKGDAGVVAH